MKVLVIHHNVPEPDRNGADVRLMDILLAMRSLRHDVTFVALHECTDLKYINDLTRHGIRVFSGDPEQILIYDQQVSGTWSFRSLLAEANFDLAVLALWFWNFLSIPEHYLQTLWSNSPRTVVAILTDDCHGLRERQLASLTGSVIDAEVANDIENRERVLYRMGDFVIAIADAEEQVVQQYAPEVPSIVVPISATPSASKTPYESRSGICMLANFANPAACDAAGWLIREILPIIREALPDVQLTLAGPHSDTRFANAGNAIRAIGYVPDLQVFFDTFRIFVAPLRIGTGIATKNLLAMSHGLPVVTTTAGARSLCAVAEEVLLCADESHLFANSVIRAYSDKDLWCRLSSESVAHVECNFKGRTLSGVKDMFDVLSRVEPRPRNTMFDWPRPPGNTDCSSEPDEHFHDWNSTKRMSFYLTAGFDLLRRGNPDQALIEFRHAVFVAQRTGSELLGYYGLWWGLEQCYRKLGEDEMSAKCRTHQLSLRTSIGAGNLEESAAPKQICTSDNAPSSTSDSQSRGRPIEAVVDSAQFPEHALKTKCISSGPGSAAHGFDSATSKASRDRMNAVAYWRKGEAVQNFGDALSLLLISEAFTDVKGLFRRIHLIGSCICNHTIREDLDRFGPSPGRPIAFWGCGLRDDSTMDPLLQSRCEFFGVRGPLTRKLLGLPEDTPIGDPGLLLPLLYKPNRISTVEEKTICIPHFDDRTPYDSILKTTEADVVISPRVAGTLRTVMQLIDTIANASFVLAGSLHAAITAFAYGIPFSFFDGGHLDIPFKWRDFAASIDIPAVFARNVTEGRQAYENLLRRRMRKLPLAPLLKCAPFSLIPGLLENAKAYDDVGSSPASR